MVIETRLLRPAPVFILAPTGDSHEHDAALRIALSDLASDVVAAQLGQADVHQYDVGPMRVDGVDSRDAVVRRVDVMARNTKHFGQRIRSVDIVVDDQDAKAARSILHRCCLKPPSLRSMRRRPAGEQ